MSHNLSFNLVVLLTARLDAMLAFYRALGLSMVQEQHGTGPVHFSCEFGELVLEIYPGAEGTAPGFKNGGATMLGFTVKSLDSTLAELQQHGSNLISPPKDLPWGRRAVVSDPDGRAIDVSEKRRG